jgi:RNA-binding protein Musashi
VSLLQLLLHAPANMLWIESLREYFSQFGEVLECTVMRDGASGRSRGFGFLTFKDPRTVNIVMVKEHYLDGKIVRPDFQTHVNFLRCYPSKPSLSRYKQTNSHDKSKIDPKRAIPRDEQERTSKIFVGGVSQEATEQDFKEYFQQFGRVVDATLMMDKDTGRPRGFGFVTFDSEAAVEACLDSPLEILGKPIEVKKAQPRGNMREEEDSGGRSGRNRFRKGGATDERHDNSNNQQQQQGSNPMAPGGVTPQMMAQYFQRMQQYLALIQHQQLAMGAGRGINPAMMAQMQQMMAIQAMQQQQAQAMSGNGVRGQSPQSPNTTMAGMAGVNPTMIAQMQQLQQMQAMQAQQGGISNAGMGNTGMGNTGMGNTGMGNAGIGNSGMGNSGMGSSGMGNAGMNNAGMANAYVGGGGSNPGGRIGTPGYNAYEQQMFEQQKYEQQQARRVQRDQSYGVGQGYGGGGPGPTSWEGMYDDVPQPPVQNMGRGGGGFGGRGAGAAGTNQGRGSQTPSGGGTTPQPAPPAGAPTGPKNAGKPGANYRGGGRGGARGYHPYARGT